MLLQVLDGSNVRMIKSFVQVVAGESSASGNTSITVQFRAQLDKLMQTLGHAPSFVKCIKPRDVIAGM
jgi:myosin heavy subunit